ncbi:DUF433 domain-containing protein [Azospirillum canadense]|uniref:DUF433 domain-containing protein n=1 Tax=Azospirillum canadense TaxID=403962 RepID=UPI0022265BAA|nr:DUF433 domain-containing protein [Azospirillum canadense]MCW2242907.1 uncharacterized protein (DUF433 family) [Azospirillum canadense]
MWLIMAIDTSFLNVGIYNIPQAARLIGVTDARLRSWMTGSFVKTKSGPKRQPALWSPHLPEMDGKQALTFLDLMEIRLVKRLLDQEKSMRLTHIREALTNYRADNGGDYPLLNKQLFTDGQFLYRKAVNKGGKPLLDLNRWQYVFEAVVAPTLDSVDMGDDALPSRWWPKGRGVPVVLDPSHAFGAPILAKRRVPTAALARAMEAQGSVESVARWYELDIEDVRAAIEFEADLAARRLAA